MIQILASHIKLHERTDGNRLGNQQSFTCNVESI